MSRNLIIHQGKVVCPRCDGNGFLYRTTLQPINKEIIMCDECDAIWLAHSQKFTNANFEDFTTYVQNLGYAYDEVNLTNVNYAWLPMEIEGER